MLLSIWEWTNGTRRCGEITGPVSESLYIEERQLNVTRWMCFRAWWWIVSSSLGTEIDDYTANTLQAQLLYLDSVDSGKDISIYINSPGGSVTAGLGIYDTMQFISSDVATICTGMAASMAAVLLVAGQEGKRLRSPIAAWWFISRSAAWGTGFGHRNRGTGKSRNSRKNFIRLFRTIPYTFDKVWKDSDRNYWMNAEEAKEYGMIDAVLTRKK